MGIYLNGKMVSTAMPLSSGNIDPSLIDSKITIHNSDPNAHSAMLKTAINNALAQAKESGEFKGDKGDIGYYFIPNVNSEGLLTWTNNGNLLNPSSVNIL